MRKVEFIQQCGTTVIVIHSFRYNNCSKLLFFSLAFCTNNYMSIVDAALKTFLNALLDLLQQCRPYLTSFFQANASIRRTRTW